MCIWACLCPQGKVQKVESTLCLVDLAGSERASNTKNKGSQLREGANINKSLLALGGCIQALAARSTAEAADQQRRNSTESTPRTQKKNAKKSRHRPKFVTNAEAAGFWLRLFLVLALPYSRHQPLTGHIVVRYRESKLTLLLKNSLEGNAILVMIAAINPAEAAYQDSHNTLKYANRAKAIAVQPKAKAQLTDILRQVSRKDAERRKQEEAEVSESQFPTPFGSLP